MYLSHPVRRIREDPAEGETITLRITAEDETVADSIAERVGEIGTVHQRLRFGGLLVTVPQPRLDEICSLDGIESIETANTLTFDADGAGEDVKYEGE
jgi:hypothetical protein